MGMVKRKHPRRVFRTEANIVDTAGSLIGQCKMANVSAGGAKLTHLDSIRVPDNFFLVLARSGTVRRECMVVWRHDTEIGVKFLSTPEVRGLNY
jgi:hypothetical protein